MKMWKWLIHLKMITRSIQYGQLLLPPFLYSICFSGPLCDAGPIFADYNSCPASLQWRAWSAGCQLCPACFLGLASSAPASSLCGHRVRTQFSCLFQSLLAHWGSWDQTQEQVREKRLCFQLRWKERQGEELEVEPKSSLYFLTGRSNRNDLTTEGPCVSIFLIVK